MKLIVSSGDLNGIGLECFVKALMKNQYEGIEFTLAINHRLLSNYLSMIEIPFYIENEILFLYGYKINLIEIDSTSEILFGEMNRESGTHAALSIEKVLNEMKADKYDAMLTLPISKEAIQLSGWDFPGHTELIAQNYNIPNPLMILCNESIRVMTLTIHIGINQVAAKIKKDYIIRQATAFHYSLIKDFDIKEPKIAILGLNPHAGENGKIGTEELEEINPAIEELRQKGINAYGAFPADGFFAHKEYQNYDGIISMYHDQGLIPLKMLAYPGGVNFTANLPIIRTSPDHGTAFGIAGKNLANEVSTHDAIKMANHINKNWHKN